ncbi:MAG TPA: hypothetical protein VGW38_04085 [Chloroflexota bacterium]|nr:hypothetical protein [Chloroflexota bacterium]
MQQRARPWPRGFVGHHDESGRLEEIRVVLEMALLGAITIAIFIIAMVLMMSSTVPSGPTRIDGERFRVSYGADYSRHSGRSPLPAGVSPPPASGN